MRRHRRAEPLDLRNTSEYVILFCISGTVPFGGDLGRAGKQRKQRVREASTVGNQHREWDVMHMVWERGVRWQLSDQNAIIQQQVTQYRIAHAQVTTCTPLLT